MFYNSYYLQSELCLITIILYSKYFFGHKMQKPEKNDAYDKQKRTTDGCPLLF